MNPEINSSGFTKILQLKKSEKNPERFNIKVKVLKMIKTFKMGPLTKMHCQVGDQTGVAQCILTETPAIKVNMSF